MHHKLVAADDHMQVHPNGPPASPEVVPSSLTHDSLALHHSSNCLSSSPVQTSAHHQHNRHNHQNPQYPSPQQMIDTEIQGAYMRDLLQK